MIDNSERSQTQPASNQLGCGHTKLYADSLQGPERFEPCLFCVRDDLLSTIERLTRERDDAQKLAQFECKARFDYYTYSDRLRAALTELVACKALREKIDGELSACHQEMSPQLQAMENEYQLRKPLAWRDARAALSGEPQPKRAYYETHDAPHCPSCDCGSAPETESDGRVREIFERHGRVNNLLYGPGAVRNAMLGPMDSDAAHEDRGYLLSILTPSQRGDSPKKASERSRVKPPKFCAVDDCYNRVASDQEVCDSCAQNGKA